MEHEDRQIGSETQRVGAEHDVALASERPRRKSKVRRKGARPNHHRIRDRDGIRIDERRGRGQLGGRCDRVAAQGVADHGRGVGDAQLQVEGVAVSAARRGELHRRLKARSAADVRIARRRHREKLQNVGFDGIAAVRDVQLLRRKLRKEIRDHVRFRIDQGQIIAGFVQLEVRVQRRSDIRPIFARQEDDELTVIVVGRNHHVGNSPLGQIIGRVGQKITVEIQGHGCAAIINLHPGREGAVLVFDRVDALAAGRGHELGD